MIAQKKESSVLSYIQSILFWGALWGIFEATVGYALHLIPWQIGSYIWFPAAYFFMNRLYEDTRKQHAVVAVAFLCATIKLLNLFTPIRLDYVINPAVSIILESLAMVCVLGIRKAQDKQSSPLFTAIRVLSTNTLWRLMYTMYVGFIVPAWMREASALRDARDYLSFLVTENLFSTAVCVIALWVYNGMKDRMLDVRLKNRRSAAWFAISILLCSSVLLQFIL